MWQEARKQEKILRGIMVDHKRRAEKRKGFYDKIKKDPTEFLQVWGKSIKIHVDSTAENNPSIMTNWHGDLIDRFDVRSHLDEYKEPVLNETDLNENEKSEEKMLNFERYKTLIQNEALGVTEKQLLKQIELDEKFGSLQSHQVKKKQETKAQIGYNYEDSSKNISSHVSTLNKPAEPDRIDENENEEDLDLKLDSKKLTSDDKLILNKCALNYGLEFGDFMKILIKEEEEKETIKKNKLLEEEKAQYSGRKSRRERRIVKDRLRKERGEISELSYIVNEDSTDTENDASRSRSNSKSSNSSRSYKKSKKFEKVPTCEPLQNQVTYITSFGVHNDNFDEIDNNLAQDSHLKVNKPLKQDNYSLNVKRLRQDATISSPRSRRSRTASKSPSNEIKKLVTDSSSSSDSTSDEEKALQKYLKRRDNRKQINSQGKSFSLVSNSDCTLINKESKISTQNTSSNFNNVISSNQNNNSISTKSTSSGDFKLYQEKLKKKMSKQINKQLKKDKEVEREKGKKERESRREREKELNYLAEKIRLRKALERKKNMDSSDSDQSSGSLKNNRSLYRNRNATNSRSRSRSRNRRKSTSRSRKISRSRRRSESTSTSRSRRNSRSRSRRNSRSRSRSRKISRTRSRSGSRTRSFSNRNLNSRGNSERKNISSRR